MHSKNLAVVAALVVILVAATTLATINSAFAGKGGREHNQATAQVNDCGNGSAPTNILCQNTNSQIQGDKNSVALASQQTPPQPTGFTIMGSGTGITLTCPAGEFPGQPFSVEFLAESDGTSTTGTYTISITDNFGFRVIREGTLTFGTTDGSTFSLSGVENVGLCNDPEGNLPTDVAVGITGDCGDEVAILYSDFWTLLTLTGNVECTLA
jgi:hypothetical protein